MFNAIVVAKGTRRTLTFDELCHSCGVCSYVCPEDCIEEMSREIGVIEKGKRTISRNGMSGRTAVSCFSLITLQLTPHQPGRYPTGSRMASLRPAALGYSDAPVRTPRPRPKPKDCPQTLPYVCCETPSALCGRPQGIVKDVSQSGGGEGSPTRSERKVAAKKEQPDRRSSCSCLV